MENIDFYNRAYSRLHRHHYDIKLVTSVAMQKCIISHRKTDTYLIAYIFASFTL